MLTVEKEWGEYDTDTDDEDEYSRCCSTELDDVLIRLECACSESGSEIEEISCAVDEF